MIDDHDIREMLQRRAVAVPATPDDTLTAVRRARRRLVLSGAVATLAAVAIAVATFAGVDAIRTARIPADEPAPMGVFAPVAGRIVFENEAEVGDLGYDTGLWALDPNGPSDTAAGPRVADDVASTLVRLDLEEATPLGWSSDGTELLFSRPDAASAETLFPQDNLYILRADGTETRLNSDPMMLGGATISPDGTRVAFAAWGDDLGLWVVDAQGGRPARLPLPRAEGIVADPTFSPDGTQMAYHVYGDDVAGDVREEHVWVANADGTDAREILADEEAVFLGVTGLQWSPTGDRLAIGLGDHEGGGRPAIYTFASDGSDFTRVIDGGISPYWSPDGSQIAYTIPCDEQPDGWCPEGSIRRSEFDPQPGDSPAGLAIADADGSNVRAFGFAASGPLHPGTDGA
jgi:Tol biopolymer transport system component